VTWRMCSGRAKSRDRHGEAGCPLDILLDSDLPSLAHSASSRAAVPLLNVARLRRLLSESDTASATVTEVRVPHGGPQCPQWHSVPRPEVPTRRLPGRRGLNRGGGSLHQCPEPPIPTPTPTPDTDLPGIGGGGPTICRGSGVHPRRHLRFAGDGGSSPIPGSNRPGVPCPALHWHAHGICPRVATHTVAQPQRRGHARPAQVVGAQQQQPPLASLLARLGFKYPRAGLECPGGDPLPSQYYFE